MNKGTCTTIQLITTGMVAFLSEKLRATFYLLGLLMSLMVIDYLSGMAASAVEALDHPDDKSYGWSSRKGAKGIAKKVAYLCVIAVAMVIDYIIIQTSDVLGVTFPNTMLSLLVTVWYLLNEALSITENAGRMGAPVPEWLMKYIAALKNKIDCKSQNGEHEEQ
ncbi:holin [Clostridium sp. AF12-19]|nr:MULTISPECIES: phage holin family protein [unclassified Clostridium]RHS23350.1 holin [Clostridium sp. AF12-19]RHS25126.1 holin [Clostridium sp. AF12-28]